VGRKVLHLTATEIRRELASLALDLCERELGIEPARSIEALNLHRAFGLVIELAKLWGSPSLLAAVTEKQLPTIERGLIRFDRIRNRALELCMVTLSREGETSGDAIIAFRAAAALLSVGEGVRFSV